MFLPNMDSVMMDIETGTNSVSFDPHKQLRSETSMNEEESDQQFFPFLALPTELQYEVIMSVNDPWDVLSVSQTCKQTNFLSKKDSIWRSLCTTKWTDIKKRPSDWKRYFYERNAFLSTKAVMEWHEKDILSNPTNLPQPRQSFTGTCVNGKIIFIGGQTSVRVRFDDIFIFDPITRDFSKADVKGNPPKFARHSAVAIGNKIYIFGGYDGFGMFYGLAVLDVSSWTWEYPTIHGAPPIPRTNHAVAAIGNKMYLFGGNDTTTPDKDNLRCGTYDDFAIFNSETMTWDKPKATGIPCGRSGHHMVAIDGKLYLFGGGLWNDSTKSWLERYNDMYMFDPETMIWNQVQQNGAPNNAFISLPHWTVGYFIFVYNDPVWCFDTITLTWHCLNTKGKKPQKRFLGPATYINTSKEVYMFGGVYAEVLNDFDKLTWPCNIRTILEAESSDAESGI